MSLYTIMLFVHVSSAICLFIGMGIWLSGMIVIARVARVEQVRAIVDLMLMVRNVVPVSVLLVIAAGVTMTWASWGFQTGWIAVALGSLVIIGPIGTWVVDPRVNGIATLTHSLPDGPLPISLAERTHDRVLRMALSTMTAMLFGIVFLMTTKPTLISAIGAMVVSAFLGLASGPLLRAKGASLSDRFHQPEEDGT